MNRITPFERYEQYVADLDKKGRKFPVNQFGEPNLTKIANESGNRRQWFTESAMKVFGDNRRTLDAIMKSDIARIGTDFANPKHPDRELSTIANQRSREANALRRMLEQKSKENELLRSKIQVISDRIEVLESKAIETDSRTEELLDTGRRFSL